MERKRNPGLPLPHFAPLHAGYVLRLRPEPNAPKVPQGIRD